MRTTFDRIRQALSFEIIGLAIVTPAGAWLFDQTAVDIGMISLFAATVATLWNYAFNLGFDHALRRLRGTVEKTVPLRVLHAVAFEAGLLAALLLPFAWWLEIGLGEAFAMEITFAGFYLVYTFVFTWIYDRLFPVEGQAAPSAA